MANYYFNPARESDPHALPDLEVFYANEGGMGEDEDGNELGAGFYWWACFPGCLPDSEAMGPFETEAEALADARDGMVD